VCVKKHVLSGRCPETHKRGFLKKAPFESAKTLLYWCAQTHYFLRALPAKNFTILVCTNPLFPAGVARQKLYYIGVYKPIISCGGSPLSCGRCLLTRVFPSYFVSPCPRAHRLHRRVLIFPIRQDT